MKGVPGLPPPPDSGCFCSPRRLQRLNPQSQERAGAQFQDPSRRAQGPLLPELRDGTGEAGPVPALPSAGPTHHPTPPLLPAPPPASGSALHPWLEEARLWATALGCFCFPCSLFPADVAKAVELLGPLLPAFQGQALDVARDSWAEAQDTSWLSPLPANEAFVASRGLTRPGQVAWQCGLRLGSSRFQLSFPKKRQFG